MRRSYFTTLGMLAAFLVLMAWYFLYEKHYKKDLTQKEERQKQFVTFEKDSIEELSIKTIKPLPKDDEPVVSASVKYEHIRLKRVGDIWNLLEPVEDLADMSQVSSLLSTLTTTKPDRVVDDNPKDLSVFGLKDPLFKIAVSSAKNDKEEIFLGKNTPVGFGVYVLKSGTNNVYKASQSLRSAFEKTAKDLRNKAIFSWIRSDIAEIELSGKTQLILKNTEKDDWILARENLPADTNETHKLLNALIDMRATDFASEDAKQLSQFGLSPASLRAVLVNKDKSRLVLSFGQAKSKIYVRREDRPIVYEVAADTWTKVSQDPAKYRLLEVAHFNRFDITRVKIDQGKESVEFLKEKTDWTLPVEPAFKVDSPKVDTLLTQIQDLRLVRYGTTAELPKNPQFVIRLLDKKDDKEAESVVLKFGKTTGTEVAVERAGLPVAFFVKASDLKGLSLAKGDFEKKPEPPKPTETPSNKPAG